MTAWPRRRRRGAPCSPSSAPMHRVGASGRAPGRRLGAGTRRAAGGPAHRRPAATTERGGGHAPGRRLPRHRHRLAGDHRGRVVVRHHTVAHRGPRSACDWPATCLGSTTSSTGSAHRRADPACGRLTSVCVLLWRASPRRGCSADVGHGRGAAGGRLAPRRRYGRARCCRSRSSCAAGAGRSANPPTKMGTYAPLYGGIEGG